MDWSNLAQDGNMWQAIANMVSSICGGMVSAPNVLKKVSRFWCRNDLS